MRARPFAAPLLICLLTICFAVILGQPTQARAQQTEPPPAAPLPSETSTPNTSTVPAPATPLAAITGTAKPPAIGPMTLHERFVYAMRANFGPGAFILPALSASYTMAHPPDAYPRDWKNGGEALARNYGSIFGEDTTGGLVHFAVAAIDKEDPRYYPSLSKNYGRRVVHAIAFTFVDKGNSGGRAFAFSNFADASSAGFVGDLWEPDGYNDASHALQRSEIQFAKLAGKNLLLEFTPEFNRLFRKIRHGQGSSNTSTGSSQDPSQR